MSPDRSTLAFSQQVYVAQGGYNACQLSVLSRTGVAQPTVIPGETETCNTFPSFTSDTMGHAATPRIAAGGRRMTNSRST